MTEDELQSPADQTLHHLVSYSLQFEIEQVEKNDFLIFLFLVILMLSMAEKLVNYIIINKTLTIHVFYYLYMYSITYTFILLTIHVFYYLYMYSITYTCILLTIHVFY